MAVTNEIIIDNVNIAISLKSNSFKAFSLKIPRKRIYKKASKNINTDLNTLLTCFSPISKNKKDDNYHKANFLTMMKI